VTGHDRTASALKILDAGSGLVYIHFMNRSYSSNELIYRPRWIAKEVHAALKNFPVLVVSGARQVGKSTFLQHEFPGFKYVSLDDFTRLHQAQTDPASLWNDTDRVIIDEAQKAPGLFSAIKLAVDRSHRKVRFLLSGSSNLLLMQRISETLAGRAVYFDMLPMTLGEMDGTEHPTAGFRGLWKPGIPVKEQDLGEVDPFPQILRGFMPPLMTLAAQDVLRWWGGYVKTYLERDVRELSQVDSLVDFRRVLEALALRTGNVLNQNSVARDTGVSQPTVHRYIKLMEISNVLHRVYSFAANRTKRIVKSPKVFFVDPALSCFLAGLHEPDALRSSREAGGLFETLVYLHLKVQTELSVPRMNLYYWRTITGKEVDFVLEHGRKLLAVEAKLTRSPTPNDIKGLLAFLDDHPQTVRGVLLHAGTQVRWMHSKIVAVPWWWIGR